MSYHTVCAKKVSSRETLHTQTHNLLVQCPLGIATVCMRLLNVHVLGL